MNYEIGHRTTYRYSAAVSQSYHLLHLAPREYPRQHVIRHSLLIDPAPASNVELSDGFGNPISIVTIEKAHRELTIHARSSLMVLPTATPEARLSAPWNDVAAQLRANLGPESFEAALYTCPSRFIRASRDVHRFAKPSFPEGRPILEAVLDLNARIHKDFAFDGCATDIATPLGEVLRMRRGVCQDFAHLEIACLRSLGIPARYVSGYLLTHPPEGQEKLIGADASHAWVSVWTPENGWIDMDPTNNLVPGAEHIAFAIGRDYQDVSPVSGVLLGGGDHEVEVSVDVTLVSGSDARFRAAGT